jgi:hypothetical protein
MCIKCKKKTIRKDNRVKKNIKKFIKFNGLVGFVRLAWILILLPEMNLKTFEHYTHFQLPDVKPLRRKCQKTMNGDFA